MVAPPYLGIPNTGHNVLIVGRRLIQNGDAVLERERPFERFIIIALNELNLFKYFEIKLMASFWLRQTFVNPT